MTGSGMPRYFFDTSDDGHLIPDADGLLLASPEHARVQAIRTLPYMALDALPDGPSRQFVVEVRDEGGARLFRAELTFKSEWIGQKHSR